MTRRVDRGPWKERVYDTTAGDPHWSTRSPRLRRFTEIWIEERKRQLGLGEVQR